VTGAWAWVLPCIALWASTATGQVQPAEKIRRVGVISPLPAVPEPSTVRALRQGLKDLGYVEGKNLVFEARYAEGRDERFPALIADLISHNLDVLVVGSTVGALAVKKAGVTVPVVVTGITDPVSTGIVPSLARPGGNITGTTFGVFGPGIAGKWVELLKEAVPRLSRVAVLLNKADPMSPRFLDEMQAAGRKLKVRIDSFEARDEAQLQKAFAAIGASGAEGMIVPNHPYFAANRASLVKFAADKRLPAIYFFNLFTEAGGLISYGGNVDDSWRRSASYVDRIVKGARPAEMPIDQPTRFELIVNLRTAKELGLNIPQSLLLRADRVIE